MMNIKELTAPCGIDCFNCQVYEDNITPQMREYLSGVLKKPEDEVACKGCRKQGGCAMYPFPCEKFIPSADQAEKYPHNLKVFNLCRISGAGLEKWAEEVKGIREKYFRGRFVVGKGPVL
jgi:hypothetical protein